ncbi:hypothetical protein B9Z19DRAFT_152731 [Tuber borchii]|uniref:Uncharacterized protein n=1 Tax=Tuber borchii TaxID=42251 RepID=A0A2T6ZQ49_TUBBO|nr:hypothetical protein B9Z19DRAFT_152731 [Tuber borchii]
MCLLPHSRVFAKNSLGARNPLPVIGLSHALGASAVSWSICIQSDSFYDLSGSLRYTGCISCILLLTAPACSVIILRCLPMKYTVEAIVK